MIAIPSLSVAATIRGTVHAGTAFRGCSIAASTLLASNTAAGTIELRVT
jgi:hypothetical protein